MGRIFQSFCFAWQGLVYCLKTQPNMRLHGLTAIAVLVLGWYLNFSPLEKGILVLTVTMVLAAEMVNTAIEAVIDLISPGFHPLAKVAKDVAAGAVFIAAVAAAFIGWALFVPKILSFIK
ncbi:diacylglycerol kinase family protein [Acetonema longum]|uniref:Diacylglycerol kinase n=1 Tax=Acetonema longum DSM 6540 TaxID=1009370 RepID=F7NKY0_9FIRM|nr:diacylglycerol kinase family protein [Acetonema longum]EGO63323.1 diacylglycerol kinase [Acetonema longum DSM 6540]